MTNSIQQAISDPRSRPKPFTFYPPRDNALVIAFMQKTIHLNIRSKLKVTETEVVGNGMDILRSLRGKRVLMMPSHSGGFEPMLILKLSKVLKDHFNYLAAMETFERTVINRWFMQRIGCYSIIRGTADRPSFQMTRKLIEEGKRWLVIFPEGQTVWQNDTVIPFQQGVTQLAFKGYEDALKNDPDADLFCLPVAVKYIYLKDMTKDINISLSRLEKALFTEQVEPIEDPAARLRRISAAVVKANEIKHHIIPADDATMNERIQEIKEVVISRMEDQLFIPVKKDVPHLDRIRGLFNAVDKMVYEDTPDASLYELRLRSERAAQARDLYDDMWRILQFVAIYEDYVRELMTAERFMDVLGLLEMEVFETRHIWGPRKAIIQIGDPVNLKDHMADYSSDKRKTINSVTLNIENSVRDMLRNLGSRGTLIFQ